MINLNSSLTRKRMFIGTALIVIFTIFIISSLNRDSAPYADRSRETTNEMPYPKEEKVFIDGLQDIEYLIDKPGIRNRVERAVYIPVSRKGQEKDLYTGTVRNGSYQESATYTSTGNMYDYQFLVDVVPVEMTYTISIRDIRGSIIDVTASCAPEELQMNKSSTCREVDWG